MHLTPDNPLTNVYQHSALCASTINVEFIIFVYNRCAPAQFIRVDKSSHISQKETKHCDLKTELKKKKKEFAPN